MEKDAKEQLNVDLEFADNSGRSESGSAPIFLTYSYKENLFAEFERLVQERKTFDGLVVDLMHTGFSLPLDILIKFHNYASRLLKSNGVLLFIKADSAVTLTKDDPSGGLSMNVYDSPFGIFARYPHLADYVCATVSGIDRRRMRGAGNTLANHILFTSTPVLTESGSVLKASFSLSTPQNWVIQFIDDYTNIESIIRYMEGNHGIHVDETLRLLHEIETIQAIFPIFTRIQFLASCYHNHKPFRLGRYLMAAGIISAIQLEELLEIQQEEGWGRNQKTYLGVLAIRKGYLNTRQLELMLNDQYLYGGYHKTSRATQRNTDQDRRIETMKNSMIGSLGAIDSAGLIQSIAMAKKTGTLTVENRDKNFLVFFYEGRPTHAKLGKLFGHDAFIEFLVNWSQGIFVFKDSQNSELNELYELKLPIDKMLLDAALYQDNINTIIAQLPGLRNVILERVWNFESLWQDLLGSKLYYFDEMPISQADKERIPDIAILANGLNTLDEILSAYEIWPTHLTVRAIRFLIDKQLVIVQQTSLFKPLSVFQKLSSEIQAFLGPEANCELLSSSLHHVHGNSPSGKRFHIDRDGTISINLSQLKASNTSVSFVLLELRKWMEAYLASARKILDPRLVDGAIARIVQTN